MMSVEIKDMSFSYHRKLIFQNAFLTAKQGDVIAILGSNGSGKTTLLKLICNLLFPKKGVIEYKGFKDNIKQNCTGLLESPKFWSNLTGDENLRCFLGDQYNEERVKDAFSRWFMEDAQSMPVRKYSLGMRQKLGLIMTFASDRKILLFDEPLNSLDMDSANVFYNELNRFKGEDRIIFLVSHIMEDLQRNCTHLYEIHDGMIELREAPLPALGLVTARFSNKEYADAAGKMLVSSGYIPEISGCSIEVKGIRLGRFLALVNEEGLISIEREEQSLQGDRL